ncbi:MAG TPA: transcription elongation factor GreA [Acholeplasmatales bacterium]|nr:MAG: transcription elongation factor GreA [Tenericutes bacterium GWF2_57_13]HAQ56112.1 transcription elongation factor GreA [Acholeplasmatales bacterium]
MENSFKITEKGLEELVAERKKLTDVDRKNNLEALKEARAQGDLSENADYDAARDEQARIEARIKEIDNIIKNAEIIRESNAKVVAIGKTIAIRIKDHKEDSYTIVGHLEANPMQKKISNESPLGKAIMGLKRGAKVTFKAETGKEIQVEILDIK